MRLAALATALMALALSAAPQSLAAAAPAQVPGAAGCAADDVGAVLCLINGQRVAHGARPLRLDRRLSAVARAHSADMVAHGYFDHSSRSGASFATRIVRSGWTRHRRSWTLGEDLAWGTGQLGSPNGLVDAWMGSPPHRAVLLDRRYHVVGIGIAAGVPVAGADGSDGVTCTADFSS
ncbi:MAG: hypothetical protein QOE86_2286 [Solirubrobacteraceae bacterium]|jgi:uncharacterized protein YkwD|nr:hypothetical protein [Solirubrobacteraceae bacterium]